MNSPSPASTTETVITMNHVEKWYGAFHALHDVNLSVRKGERIVPVSYTHLTLPTNREV